MINPKKFDQMVSRILQEEIESRAKKNTELLSEDWTEIEVDEELHGNQKKLDKNKNGKIDAEDFELLRKKTSKKGMNEDDEVEDAEVASQQEPTYVGKGLEDNKIGADFKNKLFGSFSDEQGWFDEQDYPYEGGFDFDYEEEEFPDFDSLMSKYGKKQKWFAPERKDATTSGDGRRMFDLYQKKLGGAPFRIRKIKGLEEETETEEGNKFTEMLRKTPKGGKFKLGGKEYTDNSDLNEAKKCSNCGRDALNENILKVSLSENELIDMIEKIVLDEQKKNKSNITEKKPEGLKKTEKVQSAGKKENDEYAKEVVEKMKNYLKDATVAKFDMYPQDFPQSNYDIDKKEKVMKYNPSQAVEEYIEAFAYPGQTNLVFDEIKPDDEKIEKYLKGNRTTGNAEVDEEGKALGNVVPSKVGERFKKNYDDNLYGAEQMNVSYKRQPQPVDVGGSEKMDGSLKSIRKGSTNKTQKIMNQLESINTPEKEKINEDIFKMKNLISYNSKTQ